MTRRQTGIPTEWLVLGQRSESRWLDALRRLPSGSGVVVLEEFLAGGARSRTLMQVHRICRARSLAMRFESPSRAAVRVHNATELRRALTNKCHIVLLSPIFPTHSHPERKPLPRMRAAALARLATVPVIALGGMSRRRFELVRNLGFEGWAGIDAWIRT